MTDFGERMAAWSARAAGRIDAVLRRSAGALLAELVVATPVASGRARGGWRVAAGEPAAEPAGLDPDGAATVARGEEAIARAAAGDVVAIVNAAPHARDLEYGGAGMVRGALAAWPALVERAVEEARRS
ncbi:MAG: hypothetical protein H3C38_17095 [Rhodospirillales bacterium]|nr:hypothetical protein [Rhodospirillales bacterium]